MPAAALAPVPLFPHGSTEVLQRGLCLGQRRTRRTEISGAQWLFHKLSSTLVRSGIPRGPSKYSHSKYSKYQLAASVRTTGDLGVAGLFEAPINIYFWPRKFAQVNAPKQVGGMLSTMSPIFSARVLPGREATANAIRNDSALTRGSLLQLMEQTAIIKAHCLISVYTAPQA